MMRRGLSPWQIAEAVAKSPNLPSSSRWNSPKLVYRTILGLIQGKASQANTVTLLRGFLIEETGLHPVALDVFPLTAKNAQASLLTVHKPPYKLKKENLIPYQGVYTISATEEGPYSFSVIVDYESVNNVLLVRCILREGRFDQILHGFLTPGDHQFTMRLFSEEYRSEYSLLVSHRERRLPFDRPKNSGSRLLGEAVADVHVSVPIYEDGLTRASAYEPGLRLRYSEDYKVVYTLRKCHANQEDKIDILRDGYNFVNNMIQLGTRTTRSLYPYNYIND